MNPPPPALPSARCSLRYAEFAYGSSTASVNRLPCESFKSERTSEVICPAVLYADEPTTGIVCPVGQAFLPVAFFLAGSSMETDKNVCPTEINPEVAATSAGKRRRRLRH